MVNKVGFEYLNKNGKTVFERMLGLLRLKGYLIVILRQIEFYLNKKWEEFPLDIREAVLDYIKQKKGILHQTDGFVLVRKL